MELINISLICISLGAFFMVLAVLKTRYLLTLITEKTGHKSWKILFFLMIFFLIGYGASFYFILQSELKFLILITGVVFLFGAFFVYIITTVSSNTIRNLIKKNQTEKLIEELKVSKEKYRKIVEEAGDAVYTTDYNGNFTYVNPFCLKLTGYNENEMLQKNFVELIAPEWKEKVVNFYKNQFDDRKKESLFSFQIITKSGEKKWVEQIVTQQKKGDRITEHHAIVRDITQHKRNDEEAAIKSEELARSNQELEQFAYVASHDLQEPLRLISSYLQLLEKRYKDKLDKDATDFINFAVDGSNRMKELILSILAYSQVSKIRPFEKIDLNELLKQTLTDLKIQINENKAIIKIEALPEIFGDKILIQKVFYNLVANALKFKSERIPEIQITGKKENDDFLFSIKDNGIGIQKEYASKLFTIFQHLNSKEKYSGTGIGLAICKKIIEKHGGKIWFESEFGKGSTFYFTIKVKEKTNVEIVVKEIQTENV